MEGGSPTLTLKKAELLFTSTVVSSLAMIEFGTPKFMCQTQHTNVKKSPHQPLLDGRSFNAKKILSVFRYFHYLPLYKTETLRLHYQKM